MKKRKATEKKKGRQPLGMEGRSERRLLWRTKKKNREVHQSPEWGESKVLKEIGAEGDLGHKKIGNFNAFAGTLGRGFLRGFVKIRKEGEM